MSAAPPPDAAWLRANTAQIAAIENRRRRSSAERAFARVVERLDRSGPLPVPPEFIANARRELAMPGRYQLTAPVVNPKASLLQLAWVWISDRFGRLYDALRARVHVGTTGAFALGDAIVAIAVLIVASAALRLVRAIVWERRRTNSLGSPIGSPPSAEALLISARAAAQRQEFALAIRTIFAASTTLLDLRGVVRDDASATVNELRRQLRARGPLVETPFVELARAYTATAYAERPATSALWSAADDAYDRLSRVADS